MSRGKRKKRGRDSETDVVLDKNGVFVSGWKLALGSPQFEKLIIDGVLR